jgi:hypothetical protein
MLFDRDCQQRTPGGEGQHVSQQSWLLLKFLVGARLLFSKALDKETSAVLIWQIAKQEIYVGVRFGHALSIGRATDEH